MPDLFEIGKQFVEQLRDQYVAAKADGNLTLAEIASIGSDAVRFLVDQAELLELPGAEKKILVLDAFDRLYLLLEPLIDIPYVPEWLENKTIKPLLRSLAHDLASGAIETFVRLLGERGKTIEQVRGV